jgi:hypothetical protein
MFLDSRREDKVLHWMVNLKCSEEKLNFWISEQASNIQSFSWKKKDDDDEDDDDDDDKNLPKVRRDAKTYTSLTTHYRSAA